MMGRMPPNLAAPPPPMEKIILQPVVPNTSLAVAREVAGGEGGYDGGCGELGGDGVGVGDYCYENLGDFISLL